MLCCMFSLHQFCHSHFKGDGKMLSVTPTDMEMCGSGQTQSLHLTCRPSTAGIIEVFALEIGKMNHGRKMPIAHVVISESTKIVNDSYKFRLTHTGSVSGATANLDLSLNSLVDEDAGEYYCYVSYLADVLGEEHATQLVTLHSKGVLLFLLECQF